MKLDNIDIVVGAKRRNPYAFVCLLGKSIFGELEVGNRKIAFC